MNLKHFEHFSNAKDKDLKKCIKAISENVNSDQVPRNLTSLLKDKDLAKVVYFHLDTQSHRPRILSATNC